MLHFLVPPAEEDMLPPRKAPPAIISSQTATQHAPPQSTHRKQYRQQPRRPPDPNGKPGPASSAEPSSAFPTNKLASSLALLTIASIRHCEISSYHLNLICSLAWFSSVTHLSSVFALRHYWREESNAIALYTRIGLMFCVFTLLLAVLTWSPRYNPGGGSGGCGGCPAQCYWEIFDAQNVLSDFFFFVTPSASTLVGLLQSIFVVWAYVMPVYFCISKAVFWFLPVAVFAFLGSVLRRLRCTLPLHSLNQDREASLVRHARTTAEVIRILWWNLCFPPPLLALLIQIASWCFGFVTLVVYRQESHLAVADSLVKDKWGFGQMFAAFLVGVPLLTLLETWSGESLHALTVLGREVLGVDVWSDVERRDRSGGRSERKGGRTEPEVGAGKVPGGIRDRGQTDHWRSCGGTGLLEPLEAISVDPLRRRLPLPSPFVLVCTSASLGQRTAKDISRFHKGGRHAPPPPGGNCRIEVLQTAPEQRVVVGPAMNRGRSHSPRLHTRFLDPGVFPSETRSQIAKESPVESIELHRAPKDAYYVSCTVHRYRQCCTHTTAPMVGQERAGLNLPITAHAIPLSQPLYTWKASAKSSTPNKTLDLPTHYRLLLPEADSLFHSYCQFRS